MRKPKKKEKNWKFQKTIHHTGNHFFIGTLPSSLHLSREWKAIYNHFFKHSSFLRSYLILLKDETYNSHYCFSAGEAISYCERVVFHSQCLSYRVDALSFFSKVIRIYTGRLIDIRPKGGWFLGVKSERFSEYFYPKVNGKEMWYVFVYHYVPYSNFKFLNLYTSIFRGYEQLYWGSNRRKSTLSLGRNLPTMAYHWNFIGSFFSSLF